MATSHTPDFPSDDAESEFDGPFRRFGWRIAEWLLRLGVNSSELRVRIYTELLEYFDLDDFDAVASALSGSSNTDWYTVRWLEAVYAAGHDGAEIDVARSLADALGGVLAELDRLFAPAARVNAKDGCIQLDGEHGPLVRIERLRFEPFDQKSHGRVERSLRRIRKKRTDGTIAQRLTSLPGFKNMRWPEFQGARDPLGAVMVKSPSNYAWAMRQMMAACEFEITQAQALELTAFAFRAKNWSHLLGCEASIRMWFAPSSVTTSRPHPSGSVRFFESPWQGIWAVSEECRFRTASEPLSVRTCSAFSNALLLNIEQVDSEKTADGKPPIGILSIGPSDVVEAGGEYLNLARTLVGSDVDLGTELARLVMPEKGSADRRNMALRRRGFKGDSILHFGDLLFAFDDRHIWIMQVEAGGQVVRRWEPFACYKAHLVRDDETLSYALMEDYMRRVVIALPAFTEADAKRLASFIGDGHEPQLAWRTLAGDATWREAALAAGLPDPGPTRSESLA